MCVRAVRNVRTESAWRYSGIEMVIEHAIVSRVRAFGSRIIDNDAGDTGHWKVPKDTT